MRPTVYKRREGASCLGLTVSSALLTVAAQKVVSVPASLITKKILSCQTSSDSQHQKIPQIKEHHGARKGFSSTTLKIAQREMSLKILSVIFFLKETSPKEEVRGGCG